MTTKLRTIVAQSVRASEWFHFQEEEGGGGFTGALFKVLTEGWVVVTGGVGVRARRRGLKY